MKFYLNSLLSLSMIFFSTHALGAGFIKVDKDDNQNTPEVGIWYNSKDPVEKNRLGPFDVKYAFNGEPVKQKMPIILLSHGIGGRYRNHHLTAEALANAGYMVVGVRNYSDIEFLHVKKDRALGIEKRTQQLKDALNIVKALPKLNAVADFDNIGAFGFSLGGGTVLIAAGLQPSLKNTDAHCKLHAEKDPIFCSYTLNWYQWQYWALRFSKEDWRAEPNIKKPLKLKAIAVIAPTGQIFSEAGLQQFNKDVLEKPEGPKVAIFRLGLDDQVVFPHHAEYLSQRLKNIHTYQVFEAAYHLSFIAPFPKWLYEEEPEGLPVYPANFDHMKFLNAINQEILKFFKTTMPTP